MTDDHDDPQALDPHTRAQAISMTTITYALLGFVAGLFTMTIISLYRYVMKKTNT